MRVAFEKTYRTRKKKDDDYKTAIIKTIKNSCPRESINSSAD